MRNRAKCKLCSSILESFHEFDYVTCKCGEIGVSGGSNRFETSAKDYCNFLRVDDDDKEIIVKVSDGSPSSLPSETMGKRERLDYLIKQIEDLPTEAMYAPLNHYDLLYVLRLMKEMIS